MRCFSRRRVSGSPIPVAVAVTCLVVGAVLCSTAFQRSHAQVGTAVANEQEYGISALAFAAVAAAVLLRVGLCRRAWVELPPIDERVKDSDVVESVGDTVSALHSLAPSWRNRFLVCATLCDAFALAAPGFGPEVAWFSFLPLKAVARAWTTSGIWTMWLFLALFIVLLTAVGFVAIGVLMSNYGVSCSLGCFSRVHGPTDVSTLSPQTVTTPKKLVSVATLGDLKAQQSSSALGAPHAAAVAAYERTAVSARDPRDGGYWQPRGALGEGATIVLYGLATVGLLPALVMLGQLWTCVFPLRSIETSCDSGCWSPVHIGMCAVSVVAVTLMLPLATIGFVSQQRHDAEDVAAIEISHAEAKRRTKHLRARLRQQARLNKRKRRQQRRDRAATTNPWAIGSSSSDDDDGMGSSSSDDDVAVPFEPQSSPEMAAAFSASGRVITRSRDVRVPAQRSSDGLPLSSMATPMVYLDCSAVLQLQQCSRYTISLALTKVCSAVACVFISPVHAQAATVAVAALNTGLLAMVWSRGAFANPNHDVLARVAHVMAATLSWLLVVNSSFVFSTPDLRLWGAEAPSADVLRLDNDDGAVAGHLVVVGTAATYVVTAAACAVMYFKTVGGLSLFAPSSVMARAVPVEASGPAARTPRGSFRSRSRMRNASVQSQRSVRSTRSARSARSHQSTSPSDSKASFWGDAPRRPGSGTGPGAPPPLRAVSRSLDSDFEEPEELDDGLAVPSTPGSVPRTPKQNGGVNGRRHHQHGQRRSTSNRARTRGAGLTVAMPSPSPPGSTAGSAVSAPVALTQGFGSPSRMRTGGLGPGFVSGSASASGSSRLLVSAPDAAAAGTKPPRGTARHHHHHQPLAARRVPSAASMGLFDDTPVHGADPTIRRVPRTPRTPRTPRRTASVSSRTSAGSSFSFGRRTPRRTSKQSFRSVSSRRSLPTRADLGLDDD